jgi:ABC-type uncharacterized transport system ATPase subunit
MPYCPIDIENLGKFCRKLPVVEGASFCVDSDSLLALSGLNLAGKSSLARILIGLIRPDDGAIDWKLYDKKQNFDPQRIGNLPEDWESEKGSRVTGKSGMLRKYQGTDNADRFLRHKIMPSKQQSRQGLDCDKKVKPTCRVWGRVSKRG